MNPESIARVLSDIAETASETLELQQVFHRVATSVRELIPFDEMGVLRILAGDWAVKHAATFGCPDDANCSEPLPLTAWSPRMRPRGGGVARIDDAPAELDGSFAGDADILAAGVRSALWAPFSQGEPFRGGVWLCSRQPQAFNSEHEQVLRPIAALLGSAVEHWRIWDDEEARRRRLDQVESLLGTLAESLDVREVFDRLSLAMRPILPHDLMFLSDFDPASATISTVAAAGEADIEPPSSPVPLSAAEVELRHAEYEILNDIPAELAPRTERDRLIIATGMRSWLRVPVRLGGQPRGSLGFFSRQPSQYGRGDIEVARRLADRIALMLSHQQLADEARVAAEARERAERLAATVETLTRELESRRENRVVGASRSWREALTQVGRVAPSETTVMITGESGTGKEVISRLIHQGSPRAPHPFVAINCAALPETLLESELLGHEKGAFTGAVATKIGRLEQAAGGTLFLDEIAEMSPAVQAKFLRVLQEREFQRVGGGRTIRADVRVIAATNRDLAAAMARQQFREDLFYRLNVFQIHMAPLRERPEDILLLADVFLEDLSRSMGRPATGISRDAREWLLSYHWPGNVRELRNAIERAILLCDGGLITREHLPTPVAAPNGNGHGNGGGDGSAASPADAGMDLDAMEKSYVERALGQARGNKSQAARILGLSRAQLYSRLEKHGIR